jgi:hypothetical protein
VDVDQPGDAKHFPDKTEFRGRLELGPGLARACPELGPSWLPRAATESRSFRYLFSESIALESHYSIQSPRVELPAPAATRTQAALAA